MLTWALDELGDRARAWALREENLRRARALGTRPIEASILGGMTSIAVAEERVEDAVSLAAQTIRISREVGPGMVATELCRCAAALALAGRAETAARLLACSQALDEELGQSELPFLAAENEATLARIRTRLDAGALANREEGRKLTADAAVALALRELDEILRSSRRVEEGVDRA